MQTKKSVCRFSHFFFRSATFFSPIWKIFSFTYVRYLCLKVSWLERIFSMCTHKAQMLFYFGLWGIFKSAFFFTKWAICAWCVHILFSHLRAWCANIICICWCKMSSIASLLLRCSQYPENFASLFLLIFKKRRILLEKNTEIMKNGVSSFYPSKTAYFDEYKEILFFNYI